MQKTIRGDAISIKYILLGRKDGGFHPRFGDANIVARNLAKLESSFGNDKATLMIAKGGSNVILVAPEVTAAEGDALITTHTGHNLVLRPADCLPLLIASNKPAMLALVHASRTSLEHGVIENTLIRMSDLGLQLDKCRIHIGPGITKETYILPSEMQEQLRHRSWKGNLNETASGLSVDLAGFISSELQRLGVTGRISRDSTNTAEDGRYFSHYLAMRHGDVNGRNGFACTIELS